MVSCAIGYISMTSRDEASPGSAMVGDNAAAGLLDTDSYLKTTSLRAAQIYAMHRRLSSAFAAEKASEDNEDNAVGVRSPSGDTSTPGLGRKPKYPISPDSDSEATTADMARSTMLSPSERAKYLTLLDKLSRVHTVHVFCMPAVPELHRFRLNMYVYLQSLVLEMVPPSTIVGLSALRDRLQMFEVVNAGVTSLRMLLAPTAPGKLLNKLSPIVCSPSAPTTPLARGALVQPAVLFVEASNTALSTYEWKFLTLLRLRNCGIANIDSSVHLLPSVETLDLSYNDITHIVHLHDCLCLRSLDLSHNRVRVLSNLDRVLGNVLELDISYNQVTSLDGIQKIYSLIKLNLAGNTIDDFVEVRHLSRLPCLEAVTLTGNPIAETANYRVFVYAQLLCDGRMMNSTRDVLELDALPMTRDEMYMLRGMLFRAPENRQADLSARHNSNDSYGGKALQGPHGYCESDTDNSERSSMDSDWTGVESCGTTGSMHGSAHTEDALLSSSSGSSMALPGSVNTSIKDREINFGGGIGLGGTAVGINVHSARSMSSSGGNAYLVGEDGNRSMSAGTGSTSSADGVLRVKSRDGPSTGASTFLSSVVGRNKKHSSKPLDATSFGPSGQVLVATNTSSPSRFKTQPNGRIVGTYDRSRKGKGSSSSGKKQKHRAQGGSKPKSSSTSPTKNKKLVSNRSRPLPCKAIIFDGRDVADRELYPDLGEIETRLEVLAIAKKQGLDLAEFERPNRSSRDKQHDKMPLEMEVDDEEEDEEDDEEEEEDEVQFPMSATASAQSSPAKPVPSGEDSAGPPASSDSREERKREKQSAGGIDAPTTPTLGQPLPDISEMRPASPVPLLPPVPELEAPQSPPTQPYHSKRLESKDLPLDKRMGGLAFGLKETGGGGPGDRDRIGSECLYLSKGYTLSEENMNEMDEEDLLSAAKEDPMMKQVAASPAQKPSFLASMLGSSSTRASPSTVAAAPMPTAARSSPVPRLPPGPAADALSTPTASPAIATGTPGSSGSRTGGSGNKAISIADRLRNKWAGKAAAAVVESTSAGSIPSPGTPASTASTASPDAPLPRAMTGSDVVEGSAAVTPERGPPCKSEPSSSDSIAGQEPFDKEHNNSYTSTSVSGLGSSPDRYSVLLETAVPSMVMPFRGSRSNTPIMSHVFQKYNGDPEYSQCNVKENMELYFREQVVGTGCSATKIYARFGAPGAEPPLASLYEEDDNLDLNGSSTTGTSNTPRSGSQKFVAFFEEDVMLLGQASTLYSGSMGYREKYDASGTPLTLMPPRGLLGRMSKSESITSTSAKAATSAGAGDAAGAGAGAVASGSLASDTDKEPIEIRVGILLTTTYIYFIRIPSLEELNASIKFCDAPLLEVISMHALASLSQMWLYFGLQRCMLGFEHVAFPAVSAQVAGQYSAGGTKSELYQYMILPRNKSKTHPLVTQVPQAANALRLRGSDPSAEERKRRKVRIINADSQLFSAVTSISASRGNSKSGGETNTARHVDVCHYQMLHQLWRKNDKCAPRTVIITDTLLFLCDEDYQSTEVQLTVLDSASTADIFKVKAESDPLNVTVVFRPSSVLGITYRKWRLRAPDVASAQKVAAELLKANG